MTRLIPLDEQLYGRLEEVAARNGLADVDYVIAQISAEDSERRRRDAVRQVKEVYAYMKAKYGRLEDSVNLIREDRAR